MPAPSDSIMNSIKGRIWLAFSALAVLDCFCGLGAYMAVSFLVTDTFVTIFVTFFIVAFVTILFGWWLANDVIRPIDSVTLLAKALERSPNATLPRTTGSSETDELLRTLHRNSQQLQNLISMMDEVAAGRTDVVSMPLENSDKLSASFQKLVSRVTDSISAKRDLDSLQGALTSLNADITGIRNGRLEGKIRSDHPLTKEVADTIRFLLNRLDQLARGIRISSAGAGSAVAETKRLLKSASEARDERFAHLSTNLSVVTELPGKFSTVARSVDSVIASFIAATESQEPEQDADSLTKATHFNLRVNEAARKIQKLRSQIADLPRLGRSAGEIARKTDLLAINSKIRKDEDSSLGLSLKPIVNEISALSQRAETLNKEIETLSESLTNEVSDVASAMSEIAAGSSETVRSLEKAVGKAEEFRERAGSLSNVRAQLADLLAERSVGEKAVADLANTLSSSTTDEDQLREAQQQIQKLSSIAENLHDTVSDLQINAAASPLGQDDIDTKGFPFERIVSKTADPEGDKLV